MTYRMVLYRDGYDPVTLRGNRPANELSSMLMGARDYNDLASKLKGAGVYVVERDDS